MVSLIDLEGPVARSWNRISHNNARLRGYVAFEQAASTPSRPRYGPQLRGAVRIANHSQHQIVSSRKQLSNELQANASTRTHYDPHRHSRLNESRSMRTGGGWELRAGFRLFVERVDLSGKRCLLRL